MWVLYLLYKKIVHVAQQKLYMAFGMVTHLSDTTLWKICPKIL